MSAPKPVSFTATLWTLGELKDADLPPRGLVFSADIANIRHAAPAFTEERAWHSGPVFDAAPEMLRTLEQVEAAATMPIEWLHVVRAAIAKARGTP